MWVRLASSLARGSRSAAKQERRLYVASRRLLDPDWGRKPLVEAQDDAVQSGSPLAGAEAAEAAEGQGMAGCGGAEDTEEGVVGRKRPLATVDDMPPSKEARGAAAAATVTACERVASLSEIDLGQQGDEAAPLAATPAAATGRSKIKLTLS